MRKEVIAGVTGISVGVGVGLLLGRFFCQLPVEGADKTNRLKSYFNILYPWLVLKQENKSLEDYFFVHKIKTIAIYGMGSIGGCLYNELKNSKIEVKYAIDRNAESTYQDIEILKVDNGIFPPVDAVVVTPVHAFSDINNALSTVVDYPIISLENVIYEIL